MIDPPCTNSNVIHFSSNANTHQLPKISVSPISINIIVQNSKQVNSVQSTFSPNGYELISLFDSSIVADREFGLICGEMGDMNIGSGTFEWDF